MGFRGIFDRIVDVGDRLTEMQCIQVTTEFLLQCQEQFGDSTNCFPIPKHPGTNAICSIVSEDLQRIFGCGGSSLISASSVCRPLLGGDTTFTDIVLRINPETEKSF